MEKGNIQIQLIPDILSHIVGGWGGGVEKKEKNLRNSCEVYSQEEWVPKRLRLILGLKDDSPSLTPHHYTTKA